MKAGVDLVRCKSCNVTLTVDDVGGHESRHRTTIIVEAVGRWIPYAFRGGGMKSQTKPRGRPRGSRRREEKDSLGPGDVGDFGVDAEEILL